MNVLLISPLAYSINPQTKYAGIEKLVWQYSQELIKEHQVTVIGHKDSVYPDGVAHLFTKPVGEVFLLDELKAYQSFQYLFRTFDVIHDFSHQHLASRFNAKLPSLNPFWHSPAISQYPKSPYNIIALSKWAAREFKRIYHQEARHQQTIVVDTDIYKPCGERNDRFLTLGIMNPDKGNLAAIMLCKELGVPLDVIGASGGNPEYEQAVKLACDGELIKLIGDVGEDIRIPLLQSCKALIYVMRQGYQEVTSHKVQEALLCGAPVITTNVGAMPEIITQGVDGYLCSTEDEFKQAIKGVDNLCPDKTLETNRKKYSISEVVRNHVQLYSEVAGGLRW